MMPSETKAIPTSALQRDTITQIMKNRVIPIKNTKQNLIDIILTDDSNRIAKIQQHITNPELDINMCMFSELQPVPNDMIIISNTPATAIATNRM